MTAIISTPYSRDLGDELRRLRETCTQFHGRAMAVQLGWDPSKVSDIELGKVRASDVDVVQYLATCGKDIDFIDAFRSRYYNAFDLYFAQLPDNLRTLAMTEAMATRIVSFDILTVHGLLQTESYARELFVDSQIEAPEDIERFVQARMERQAIMRRPNRPECVFYLHELALRMRLGDAALREDQYLRLLFNTHILRIVPAHVCAFRSAVTLYEFGKAAPVVYSDSDTAEVYAQDSIAVARTRRLFQRLDGVALDAEQSKRKLAEYVSGLREDPHVGGTDLA
ncbi:helix-turn-helix domain-containing protein [Lentzea sp. NEAU-D7]|uniref:helix-turn-helix domain-containing protein n=1 Tax=Lentzea sp. NEAU-D7 TaxID=2994667 RepID=UPI00224AB45C|nr:helix-turn-helix transcriptional regulator [Lentzea sp. NEAU-D7]MCX2950992.1 helix-turn-helix transcriptional regulator [Lentzea sp. NEAU-D7]